MCGRYYVDDGTMEEIRRIARRAETKLWEEKAGGERYPSLPAPALLEAEGRVEAAPMIWGFPRPDKKGVIFNARSESAQEKPLFRESLLHRRCILPAAGFYEWDSDKNKVELTKKGEPVLFMAGFYQFFDAKRHFVILTTAANPSMKQIHSRMPLILERKDVTDWLLKKERMEELLSAVPGPLLNSGYQESLFPPL